MHLEHDRREIDPSNFSICIRWAINKVLFGIQPIACSRSDPTTPALALIGAGLANRLYRQTLQFRAVAIATDARKTRIDDKTNVWHRQRRFRYISRKHNASFAALRIEHAALIR